MLMGRFQKRGISWSKIFTVEKSKRGHLEDESFQDKSKGFTLERKMMPPIKAGTKEMVVNTGKSVS